MALRGKESQERDTNPTSLPPRALFITRLYVLLELIPDRKRLAILTAVWDQGG